MQLSQQTLVQFAALTLAGIAVLAMSALFVTDYRGCLTRYAHRCWQFYQHRWYQRLFLWTSSSRARYADEIKVRRMLRLPAFPGLAVGLLLLSVELSALITGHVS